MKHRVKGFKLNRTTEHRRAMWRNQATALFTHDQITTTVPKAKALQPFVEKLITLARKGDLASRRRVIQKLGDPYMVKQEEAEDVERNRYGELVDAPRVVRRLFEEIGPRYQDRDGGYTRIVRLGTNRLGDGADLCVLQLVGDEEGPQISGQYSRRREKANRRMQFAARLRKGGGRSHAAGDSEAAGSQAADGGAGTATVTAEASAAPSPDESSTLETATDQAAPDAEAQVDPATDAQAPADAASHPDAASEDSDEADKGDEGRNP